MAVALVSPAATAVSVKPVGRVAGVVRPSSRSTASRACGGVVRVVRIGWCSCGRDVRAAPAAAGAANGRGLGRCGRGESGRRVDGNLADGRRRGKHKTPSGRLGAPKAVTATAHKLARVVYHLVRYGAAYVRKTEDEYAAQVRGRVERAFHRRAKELG